MEQGFLRILPGSPVSIVTPLFHDLNATLCQKDKRAKPGNLQKKGKLFRILRSTGQTFTFTLSILVSLKS